MGAAEFWSAVDELRTALGIAPRGGSVRDRKRIALVVTDAFMTAGGPLHQAAVLEWQLFEATAGLGLTCDLLPDEERCTEQVKDPKRDALKLHARPRQELLTPCALVRQVIDTLMQKESQDDPTGGEPQRIHPGRKPTRTSQDFADRAADLDGKRLTIHQGRPAALLSRTERRPVAEHAGADPRSARKPSRSHQSG